MTPSDGAHRTTCELPLRPPHAPAARTRKKRFPGSLSEPFLVENALWFCRLRWVVVALLAAFGVVNHVAPQILQRISLQPQPYWPFVVAGVLAVANIGFLTHARSLKRSAPLGVVKSALWSQIVFDLLVLTAVVHFVGSVETYTPFAYLFHIVLACIFFSRRESFTATLMACLAYAACVTAETAGILRPAGIYASRDLAQDITGMPMIAGLNVLSASGIFLVVWYLTSHLSALIRERDQELIETNKRLREAQEETAQHMVRTTHELKAPFAAIHANTELLLKGYCGVLPDKATEVVQRIAARSHRLAGEIQKMLHLAHLRSTREDTLDWVELDVADVLKSCMTQLQVTAEERGVTFEKSLRSARTMAVEEQMQLLFINLLSNAVVYSYKGGCVRVECQPGSPQGPVVTIEDHGIGIPADKMPYIFDEYYRTNEAVRHNKDSTGLGLTIVQHVAQTHQIRVQVQSEPGAGTTFVLRFPAR